MSTQLTFKFEHTKSYVHQDFIISHCNRSAYLAIQNYTTWKDGRILVLGQCGSGKTHLCKIFENQAKAEYFSPEIGNTSWLEKKPIRGQAYIVDSIDKLVGHEKELFHFINFCREEGAYLLMTSDYHVEFKLPDLRSRIRAMDVVLIDNIDDDLTEKLIVKYFTDRDIKIKKHVLNFLSVHSKRSFVYIKNMIDKIDDIMLTEKKPLSTKLALKAIMEEST